MHWTSVVMISFVTSVVVLVGAAALVHRTVPAGEGWALHSWSAAPARYGHERGYRHGHDLCTQGIATRAASWSGWAASALSLTAPQQTSWLALETAMAKARADLAALCLDAGDDTAPARVDRFTAALRAGLDAVERIRPAFDAFYDSLDTAQRRIVDGWTTHGLGGHGHRRHAAGKESMPLPRRSSEG